MPEQTEACVKSILEDPDKTDDESRAWAICSAQFEADVDDPEVYALAETRLMAEGQDGLDKLCERRSEWKRVENEAYGVAWIGLSSGDTIFKAAEQRGGYEYPDAAPEDAPPEVQEAVERFREDPDPDTPLLYWLLGTGTPAYKMAKADADYQEEPEGDEACANCEYAYEGMDGRFICSQVAGEIAPDAWCRLWDGLETSESQLAQQAVEVDAIALEFPPGGEVINHDDGDWEAFLDDLDKLGDVFQVWKGIQLHPEDDLESHDHSTYVSLTDGDVTDVEAVLADHPAVEYTINAGSVGAMDQPDDWDPEASEFYHGTGAVEQESMRVFGLSQEAREAMEERYNVTVIPGG